MNPLEDVYQIPEHAFFKQPIIADFLLVWCAKVVWSNELFGPILKYLITVDEKGSTTEPLKYNHIKGCGPPLMPQSFACGPSLSLNGKKTAWIFNI